MTKVIEKSSPCKARDVGLPAADREFVIAAVRTARTRLHLIVCELDEIGVGLKHDMLPLEVAVQWMADLNVLQFVNPDVWRELHALEGQAVAA